MRCTGLYEYSKTRMRRMWRVGVGVCVRERLVVVVLPSRAAMTSSGGGGRSVKPPMSSTTPVASHAPEVVRAGWRVRHTTIYHNRIVISSPPAAQSGDAGRLWTVVFRYAEFRGLSTSRHMDHLDDRNDPLWLRQVAVVVLGRHLWWERTPPPPFRNARAFSFYDPRAGYHPHLARVRHIVARNLYILSLASIFP